MTHNAHDTPAPGPQENALTSTRTSTDSPEKGVVWPAPPAGGIDSLIGQPIPGPAFTLPVMTIDQARLDQNIREMAQWCSRHDVDLAPHAKTTMSPQLLRRQLDAGAWGLTAATMSQVMALYDMGFRQILLANELVDPAGVTWLARMLAADLGFRFYCYVDSAAGIDFLERELMLLRCNQRVSVMIELGHPGGRTGCRTGSQAMGLAERVRDSTTLTLSGVAGYEGSIGHDGGQATLEKIREYITSLKQVADQVSRVAGPTDGFVASAGGSAFFDVVADQLKPAADARWRCLLRSGAYVTHDDGFYQQITPAARGVTGAPRFAAALQVLAYVLSRPEAGLAILGAGRRDVPWDEGLPVIRSATTPTGGRLPTQDLMIERLNDQHAFLRVSEGNPLGPGDIVTLGISHPCTAFDKWRVIPIVDNGRVTELARTAF